jgi:DNA-binding protein H-NS
MSTKSIASQLASISKQKELLLKKEVALIAQSHGKILKDIVKMAKDAGLSLEDISQAFNQKSSAKSKLNNSFAKPHAGKASIGKPHTMKGIKLPPKYRNPADQAQTWTGRGVDPSWVAKLREAGQLETAIINVAN